MKRFLILLLFAGSVVAFGQTSSVLSSGKWYKLSVLFDGVYKIDYSQLKKMGVNPDALDPRKISLYAGMNSMLPQVNNAFRTSDLQELSIYVQGGDDGKFNSQDYILFFGQGPDHYELLKDKKIIQYENNLFSDKNYYFLTLGATDGKRLSTVTNLTGNFKEVTEFDDFSYYETEQYNELHSGRNWFGELFDSKLDYTIRFTMPGILENSDIKVVSSVMGQSFSESSFQLFYNGKALMEQKITPIVNSQYAIKGSMASDTVTVQSSTVNASAQTNQDINVKFVKASTGRSVGYLDHLLLQTKRKLALYGDQTLIQSLKSLEQSTTRYTITSMPVDGMVWDVTDPFNAHLQETLFTSGSTTFSAESAILKKYVAVSNKNYPSPVLEGTVPNQNLHGITAVDVLIVTAPEFLSDAQRLASHRESRNSLRAVVVTTQQVYNEFSGGKQDVTALRDLVKYVYDQKTGIKNLLLFGRGSYDYKNYLPYNKNFVPTYESRNSLSPLETYSSDDYFGFLENTEGNWGENPPELHTLDIGVGRFPVKRVEEATILVDKIIEYEGQNGGDWRKKILFVADDGDFNIHQGQADELAESIEANHPEFNALKLYVDAFKQTNSPIGQVSPEAMTELIRSVNTGVVIVNYTGHGNEQQWMQERIFDQISLEEWKTGPQYPLLVTATCEFGRNDDPGLISTAELSLLHKDGGSIGLVTTARPVNSSTNFTLNKAFYQALFTKTGNEFRDLGSIVRDTKNNSISGVSNRNFSLLGDPSMKLALPSTEVKVTSLTNLSSGSDTLKALSNIKVTGMIYTNGTPDAAYNGILSATLFDKATNEKTKGDENPVFDFKEHNNPLFNGQASIQGGQFEMKFTVPATINRVVGLSKFSLYATSTRQHDVAGVVIPVKVGSVEKSPELDTQGPEITLFMGDTTFRNGGITGTDSRIVAILTDEHGINLSNFDPTQALSARLDDSVSYSLNRFYRSDVNNSSRGKVDYPLYNLKPGLHRLTLTAHDVFGNSASTTISFSVSDHSGIQVEQWLNYPNPAASSTTFHFKHNRSGEDLEAIVTVYDQVGQALLSSTYQISSSTYQVDLPVWDCTSAQGTKISPGLYLLKLSVRSLQDGSKNEKITKVIISN